MQLLVNALITGSFAALMAAGLSLVYGVLGVFNMALGQIALVGGYVTWWLVAHSLPLPLAILGGVLAAAVVTALSFELAVAPFYQRHRFLPLVTTIALSMVLDGAVLILFHEEPKSIIAGRSLLHVGSTIIATEQVVLIALTVVFLAVLTWALLATPLGRRVRATVQHPAAAQSLGINAAILHRAVFILSGVLAGCAGIFQGIDLNLTPVLGFSITIKAYAALIAGGKESLKGTIFCAYLIALLEQLAVGVPWFGVYISSGYQSTVALLVIILMLLIRPQGLFGSVTRCA